MSEDPMPWKRYPHLDPRRHLEHAAHVIGRRGTALCIFGTVWACLGISTLVTPPDADAPIPDTAVIVGTAWIITGVVAVMTASNRQGRDALGFMALYVMAAYRLLTELLDVVRWIVPDGTAGDLRGLVGVLAWVAIIALIVLISGWREPER